MVVGKGMKEEGRSGVCLCGLIFEGKDNNKQTKRNTTEFL